jgi:hypothetical protein
MGKEEKKRKEKVNSFYLSNKIKKENNLARVQI